MIRGLEFVGGRINASSAGSGTDVWYYTRDHLGSTRLITDAGGAVKERSDYYPFGLRMEGGTQASGNRWRFAGKEEQKAGITLDWLNFGARMYDPCLGRWTTQDPLAEKYPGISPYAYCAGNPMNLVDPDGREWEEKDGIITVKLNYTNSANLTPEQIAEYQKATKEMFNQIISTVSGGLFSGDIVFCQDDPSIIQSLDYGIFADNSIGGRTEFMSSFINPLDGNGALGSPESIAQSTIHELFHTVRLDHPFSLTQSDDTQLIKTGPNRYMTTWSSDVNIVNNIMNYSIICINGQYGHNLIYLTNGQFDFLRKEIALQNKGFGFLRSSADYEQYYNYWLNIPGIPVE